MVQETTLHILNGQAMYDFFKRKNFLQGQKMIPFNEAMCFGETTEDLFTPEFIEKRAKVHHVTPEKYTDTTLNPLKPLFTKGLTHIELWFDEDMFCQINILTILAWLDKNGHSKPIDLHIVGDKFEPIESYTLLAKGYYELFKQVMIHKTLPDSINLAPLMKGVELYLTYLQEDSDLITYIKNRENMSAKELVYHLLVNFKKYGLGDVQYLEIIRAQRSL
ncbi:AraC family transcriptional regulator [Neobacillus sp. 179-C4.2 HS]|uniref:AraC family transcriptional regulator n=1 Tax=Neobacillus driksii TaxID=3035913 RepID=A0ABV4YVN6_9BACI|nr:AraC family transcriptional regulator [Neobacillus sp. 179.-C4.2 HS]MDP5193974.1 AraC family transcriptional regulator [Neobacillus sp. 179.-C4.2 HS]